VRTGLIAFIILALVFGWFAIRWQIGNLLAANYSDSTGENAKLIAQEADLMAPSDPKTSLLLARTEDYGKSLGSFEQAVKLSPSDYKLWIEFARANEQAGEVEKAESAFRQAIKLAPDYSSAHWFFGNFLLRQNRVQEAFVELRKSAENNVIYHQQVFSLAWNIFGQDVIELEKIVGESPELQAGLAKFYAAKGRAEDSLRVWNLLSEKDKQENIEGVRVIARSLYEKQLFRSAIEFVRQLGIEPEAKSEAIQNQSFETSISEPQEVYFGWKISQIEKITVKLDPTQKHEGNRSLRITFNGYSQPTLFNISQIVTVESKARYRLSFWIKTESLKSGGNPTLEIYNVADNKTLATTAPFTGGTNDWQSVSVEFTAPENSEAVALRTTRAYCDGQCPIFGTLWYDDFKLEKLK